jgi:hypothetical protein
MKQLAVLSMCAVFMAASEGDMPPKYKGLVCMGWVKPDAQAVADGDSQGEALVVNTDLTADEKKQLYDANQESAAAFRKREAVENGILAHHHLLFPLSHGSDWMREGPCGDTPMIRLDEYHITQFVPSNPKYPGDNNWEMTGYRHEDPAKCRAYFADMRKRAVKAKY